MACVWGLAECLTRGDGMEGGRWTIGGNDAVLAPPLFSGIWLMVCICSKWYFNPPLDR
jgi:hypothetical protein